jgi:ADP-dependent NAD(P)H-hydrate dehydratase / NAD(P)H-hydrate epimerase
LKVLNSEQILQLDKIHNEILEPNELIRRASRILHSYFMKHLSVLKASRGLILCGPGHCGEDGRFLAEALQYDGWAVEINNCDLEIDPASYDYVVDAVFGVGLNRNIEGQFLQALQAANEIPLKISIDLPSGLCGTTGKILGFCFQAHLTLTLGFIKSGLLFGDGPKFRGELVLLSLGYNAEIVSGIGARTVLVNKKLASLLLPPVIFDDHKSNRGRVLLIGGSSGMEGAIELSSLAALRSGAGYVEVATEGAVRVPSSDVLTKNLHELSADDFNRYDAILIGPGLKMKISSIKALILRLVREYKGCVIIDAGALDAVKGMTLNQRFLLTPHAGELRRLTGKDVNLYNRHQIALELARTTKALVLAKGPHSILVGADIISVNYSGNSSLAKSGTGDVLSGIILALVAQTKNLTHAAALGAYLHGRAADLWLHLGYDERGLLASDLPLLLSRVMRELAICREASR